MTKMISLVIISFLLFSCTSKEKKVDVLWQKVIKSKNAKEEKEALQNFWSDFSHERIGVSIFFEKRNGSFQELEKLSKKDSVKSIKVEITFGNNDINLVKIITQKMWRIIFYYIEINKQVNPNTNFSV